MAVESLDIRVRQQGANTVARDVRNIGFAADATTGRVSGLRTVLSGIAVAAVTRRVAAFADEFTQLRNRVRLFSSSAEETNRVTQRLISVANTARTDIDSTSSIFQRLALNADRLGISLAEATEFTETISKAVAISGATAEEAGGALRQLGQGIASDFQAGAQELNSITEQVPALADAIARGLGISTTELKDFAEQGNLTGQAVLQSLRDVESFVEGRFSRVAPTIGQGFQVLTNSVTVFVGRAFAATDAGDAIAGSLLRIGRAITRLSLDSERLNQLLNTTVQVIGSLIALRVASFILRVARGFDAAAIAADAFVRTNVAAAFTRVGAAARSAASAVTGLAVAQTLTARGAQARGAAVTAEAAARLAQQNQAVRRSATGAAAALAAAFGRGTLRQLRQFPRLLGRSAAAIGRTSRSALSLAGAAPFTTLAVGAGVFGGTLFALRGETVQLEGETVRFGDIARAVFANLGTAAATAFQNVRRQFRGLIPQENLREFVNDFLAIFVFLAEEVGRILGAIASDAVTLVQRITRTISAIPDRLRAAARGDFGRAFESVDFSGLEFQIDDAASGAAGRFVQTFERDLLGEGAIGFANFFGVAEDAAETARARRLAERPEPSRPPEEERTFRDRVGGESEDARDSVLDLIESFDTGAAAAIEFAEANTELSDAIDAGVVTADQARSVFNDLAVNRFRRLASETDEVAELTIEHRDNLRELNQVATSAGISSDELGAAQERLRAQFERSVEQTDRFRRSLLLTDSIVEGLDQGITQTLENTPTQVGAVADATESVLNRTSDALDEFVTTGKFQFNDFASSVIADIQKVINDLLLLEGFDFLTQEGSPLAGLRGRIPGLRPSAQADTGRSQGTDAVLRELLGGGARPTGAPGDPLFVRFSGGGPGGDGGDGQGGFRTLGEELSRVFGGGGGGQQDFGQGTTAGAVQTTLDGLERRDRSFLDSLGGQFNRLTGELGGLFSSLTGSLGESLGGLLSGLGGLFSGGGGGGGGQSTTGQVLGIVSGLLGAAGGTGALANGGTATRGGSFLVGERGPELFTPRRTGTVTPNEALGASAPPQVNVQVTNVDDPKSVPNAMSTRDGEKVIMNVIQRNRGKLKEITK